MYICVQYADQSAYVTLKDHKENFKTKLTYRLINPAKSNIGIVSKVELEEINRAITNQTKCNQWGNTQAVIDWFKSIPNKTKARFVNLTLLRFILPSLKVIRQRCILCTNINNNSRLYYSTY